MNDPLCLEKGNYQLCAFFYIRIMVIHIESKVR